MSDAHADYIDDNVRTLVRLCGYSADRARAELTAFSHREKVGLIPASRALQVLVETVGAAENADTADANRRQWREILRTPEGTGYLLAA